jgi:ABC-type transport system involved in cytochrome bd biosynthesis fused ATPase/permease subunit
MKQLIKDTPWGVTVAIVFLIAVYVTLCVMAPQVALFLGVIIGTLLSILRVLHYLSHRN